MNEKFREAAEYCRKLAEAGRLASGVEFYISKEGKIAVKPLIPQNIEELGPIDLTQLTHVTLSSFQQLRYSLGKHFDLSSATWNSSPIGVALANIEKELRAEHYKTESREKKGGDEVYNVASVYYLQRAIIELGLIIVGNDFRRRWRWGQYRILNRFARDFSRRNQNRRIVQVLHMQAQLILALDEYCQKYGEERAKELVDKIVETNIITYIKQQFGEI